MSTKTNDLKQEIKGILLDSKEKERIARVAANASLKTITFFCNEKNPSCKTYRDYLKQEGIKFNEKEVSHLPIPVVAKLGLLRTFQQTRIYSKLNCVENMLISHKASDEGFSKIFSKILSQCIYLVKLYN